MANSSDVFLTAVLLTLLATYVCVHVTRRATRALGVDVWASLLYLGMAEHDEPAVRRPAAKARAQRVAQRPAVSA